MIFAVLELHINYSVLEYFLGFTNLSHFTRIFDRHIRVLRGLWEHNPLSRFPDLTEPVLWLPADSGDVAWTSGKRQALEAAERLLARSRTHWFSPAHHDVHAQQPDRVTELLLGAVGDGFFATH